MCVQRTEAISRTLLDCTLHLKFVVEDDEPINKLFRFVRFFLHVCFYVYLHVCHIYVCKNLNECRCISMHIESAFAPALTCARFLSRSLSRTNSLSQSQSLCLTRTHTLSVFSVSIPPTLSFFIYNYSRIHFVHICIYIFTHIYICIYIHMYVYIHIYTYIYVYI